LSAGVPPQTPLGELTALSQTPLLNLRGPTSKGRGGGRGGEGKEGEKREGEGRGEEEREGSGTPPPGKILATGL